MKKILMVILDGFGMKEETYGNAIKEAGMPYFHSLWDNYPHSLLEASGPAVGLPEGQFGTSEVCHEVIGLGKKIKQKLSIITDAVNDKSILENKEFNHMLKHLEETGGTLHLMGLVSDGGVHSDLKYILKLIPLLKEKKVKKIVFHAITDGRDTGIKSSVGYLKELEQVLEKSGIGILGSICGRYYAMDRDNNWDRTRKYYDLVVNGIGFNILNFETAINNLYLKNITDEFLPPILVNGKNTISDNDALLWLNFRADRTKQTLTAIGDENFNAFLTKKIKNLKTYMLFKQVDVPATHLYELENSDNLYPLGEYLSDLKINQARVAETEKYNHVTYYFNAEKSKKFPLCTNILVPSPKVAKYDETPLMSAIDVTKQVKKCMENDYDFIVVNYANPDMIGHTGNMEATVKALMGIDKILENLIEYAEDNFYKVMILSDHGNCDEMLDEKGNIKTTHSTSPVPFILLDKKITLKEKGDLTNVAPTILKYMDITIPKEMEGSKNLIIEDI